MRIAILALDHVYLSCIASALDVVELIGTHRSHRLHEVDPYARASSQKRAPLISLQTVSVDGRPVRTTGSTTFAVAGGIGDETFDIVFVPAFADDSPAALDARLAKTGKAAAWLCRQHENGAVLVANHLGIYILAQAGLLARECISVPLAFEAHFRKTFPRVRIDMSRAVVESPKLIYGAGLGSTYDLFLRVIGQETSSAIRQRLFHELFFAGLHWGDAGAAGAPEGLQDVADPLVERAQSWLIENLSKPVNMRELARFASTSQRTLYRRFKEALGISPHQYLRAARLETAKRGLVQTKFSIEQVAAGVGYKDPAFFARAFKAHVGMTPAKYRRDFREA